MGGGKKKSKTEIKYVPAPPPAKVQVNPTQSLRSQIALSETAGAQSRLNMTTQANLDRTNKEFFTGQNIRQLQSAGAQDRLSIAATSDAQVRGFRVGGQENRATIAAQGAQTRLNTETTGQQQRLTVETTGQQERLNIGSRGTQERLNIGTRGTEERLSIGKTGEEQRLTLGKAGEEERLSIGKTGEEQRLTIGKTGQETRSTQLQSEMFRRYKENRDFEQAQSQYRA